MRATTPPIDAIWHELECGAYAADLELWAELAAEATGPVLELGAGTGRVALGLAARGFEVTALDNDPVLLSELQRRARSAGTSVEVYRGDAREFTIERSFALIAAPMQVIQLLGGPGPRARMLARAREHLAPGGALAVAVLAGGAVPEPNAPPPLPDLREIDGVVYSSQPVSVRALGDAIEVVRLRQVVSPTGSLGEETDVTRLDPLPAEQLVGEAASAGLRERERFEIPATDDHVGSIVIVFEMAP